MFALLDLDPNGRWDDAEETVPWVARPRLLDITREDEDKKARQSGLGVAVRA